MCALVEVLFHRIIGFLLHLTSFKMRSFLMEGDNFSEQKSREVVHEITMHHSKLKKFNGLYSSTPEEGNIDLKIQIFKTHFKGKSHYY